MSKPIREKLEAERKAHAATAKQLADVQAALGRIEDRVDRFQKECPYPTACATCDRYDAAIADLTEDLRRMV